MVATSTKIKGGLVESFEVFWKSLLQIVIELFVEEPACALYSSFICSFTLWSEVLFAPSVFESIGDYFVDYPTAIEKIELEFLLGCGGCPCSCSGLLSCNAFLNPAELMGNPCTYASCD